MTTAAFLDYLAFCGIVLTPNGAMLRYKAPKGVITTALRQEISLRKSEILAILQFEPALLNTSRPNSTSFSADHSNFIKTAELTWPEECLECERKIGQKYARLFPLLNRQVETPFGAGILKQVFQSRAAILITDHLVFVHPDHVRPINKSGDSNFKGDGSVGTFISSTVRAQSK